MRADTGENIRAERKLLTLYFMESVEFFLSFIYFFFTSLFTLHGKLTFLVWEPNYQKKRKVTHATWKPFYLNEAFSKFVFTVFHALAEKIFSPLPLHLFISSLFIYLRIKCGKIRWYLHWITQVSDFSYLSIHRSWI